MRDATRVRHSARPLPIELKLLLAGGFVLAGWLLTAVLGAPSAAADEAPSEPDTVATQQQPSLLGTVTGLVDTVGTTLSAVTETAETTLTTVTETADQATAPIVEIVDQTVQTVAPKAPSEPAEPEPVAKTEAEPVTTQTAAAAPKSAPAIPAAPAPVEPVHAVVHHAPVVKHTEAAAQPRHQDIPDPVRADNAPPAPAPTDPGDPGVAITVSHDSGNGGRDLMAVLGPRASAEPVQPIVGALTSGFVGMGTEAGLPPTSPD